MQAHCKQPCVQADTHAHPRKHTHDASRLLDASTHCTMHTSHHRTASVVGTLSPINRTPTTHTHSLPLPTHTLTYTQSDGQRQARRPEGGSAQALQAGECFRVCVCVCVACSRVLSLPSLSYPAVAPPRHPPQQNNAQCSASAAACLCPCECLCAASHTSAYNTHHRWPRPAARRAMPAAGRA